ncbi:MAG: hypothetical protein IK018_10350 [Lachnospiraceae bacterium]|nr:hypothetical protein [Lachnospiraceae bacterium]
MKKFINAELEEIKIAETAMGPQNPEEPDDVKYAVTDEEGNILGWRATFGNNGTKSV